MVEVLLRLDTDVLIWIHRHLHNGFFDWLMPLMRSKWTWIPLYVFLFAFVLINFGKRGVLWILMGLFVIALSDTVTSKVMKPEVKRIRPCHTELIESDLRLLISCGGLYSFPSSHASNHFGLATFFFFTLGQLFRRARWPVMIWAALIAFAQVYVGVHYPLDVIAGAAFGILLGISFAWYYNSRLGTLNVER